MKLFNSIVLSLGLTGFLSLAEVSTAAEEASAIEQTSPNGNYQIQWVENQDSRFIVSSKNPAERAPLPGSTGEVDPAECQVVLFTLLMRSGFFMPSIGDIMGCSRANSTITKRASSLRLAKEKGSLLGNFKDTQLGTVLRKAILSMSAKKTTITWERRFGLGV